MFFWVVDEESNKKTGIKVKQFMHKKQHTKSALSLFFPQLEVCALNIFTSGHSCINWGWPHTGLKKY